MNESEKKINSSLRDKLIGLKNKLVSACLNLKKVKFTKLTRKYLTRLKKIRYKFYFLKLTKWLSSSWKFVLSAISSFLLFYYAIGSLLIENIDVKSTAILPKEHSNKFETANTMAFLIDREIDKKMWTPNLPIIFPSYVLDNMPNFQVGIIRSVRDNANVLFRLSINNEAQLQEAKEADTLLKYSPYIWLLSKKSTFNIAPSSNAQYRKAKNALLKYNENGIFAPREADLDKFLAQMSISLRKRTKKNETQVVEHSSDWFDNKADNIFYYNRGFAFASWQIANALGFDYKEIILQNDVYTEWTYLISALRKAATFAPSYVRNGEVDGLIAPNHLMVQNYYLERAQSALENIRRALQRGENGY